MTREGAGHGTGMIRRLAFSLVLAYVLVLQALLGGLATGAHAGALLDPNAAPMICSGLGPADTPSSPGDPTHHTPDCCSLGCQNAAVATLPPVAAGVPASLSAGGVLLSTAGGRGTPPAAERLAHPPRAPPFV